MVMPDSPLRGPRHKRQGGCWLESTWPAQLACIHPAPYAASAGPHSSLRSQRGQKPCLHTHLPTDLPTCDQLLTL